jgi:hydrogenase-4 component B
LLNMLVPVVAALIALVAALAGYTMVKFFGVIFLGQPREESWLRRTMPAAGSALGMLWLAPAACCWACCPCRSSA